MIGLILRVIALLLFLIVGFGWSLGHVDGLRLVGFGLACWVLATLLGGYGPASPIHRE